ncbi:MAG: type ISP restriction/modification enzyme, partial [Candidatus Humimicrobiaceae bacterium]
MQNIFENYIYSISSKFAYKETTELGYRTDFEILLKGIFESIKVTRFDHDAKAKQGNKPDFVVLNHDIPILYIETKDIGVSLDKVEKSEQMSRYYGYANLVLTDYVEFRFYRNGLRYEDPIKIANYDLKTRTISTIPENYEHVAKTLIDFTQSHKEPIKSGEHLSKIMGGKAQRIRDNVRQFLAVKSDKNTELTRVYETIKKLLVHDLTEDAFADMYAQTLVYGLFAARYHDETPSNFTRQEARDLIPKSNPLLRHFFDHIVGPNFDKRLEYIVNELCEVFSHADIAELMKEYFKIDLFGESHKEKDPVIHFYEDFLKEYDPNLRKKMGAYYTPPAVVQFIVRSVDYLLKKEFGLSEGLADTSKLENGTHRVQILDPAVGTGTFISSVINTIYSSILKSGQKGRWPAYVHNDLLPRLHGFELMMAPYTIAHLKIGMTFRVTGFMYFNRRLGIYLTNSLEKCIGQGKLFTAAFGLAESIAEESKEASVIKNETPIMIVIGNPPYNISSSNKGEWIQDLIKDYKKNLNEKKINIDDDYIKFIRLAEYFIEKNKNGIVAMITNNSFIDGITHRQMRKHLLETFDDIYILDLHGNSKKKEKAPDGKKDENVFNIQQGVSINIFIRKKEEKNGLGKVHYAEIHGKRDHKFKILNEKIISEIKWKNLDYSEPYYFFITKNFKSEDEYINGFKIDELIPISNSGVKTDRDALFIDIDKNVLEERMQKLLMGDYNEKFKKEFRVIDSGSYKLTEKLRGKSYYDCYVQPIQYRPFDYRWIYYDHSLVSRSAYKVMSHIVEKENIAIVASRQFGGGSHFICFITKIISEISSQPFAPYTIFPLYLYSRDNLRTYNVKKEIINGIEKIVGNVSPEDIFDYIYAVLHSPNYREKYKEFLKIDFPRIPYPEDEKSFKKLATLGTELRLLHLLESPKLSKFITTYPYDGSNIVEKTDYKNGNVYINEEQYFGNVPEVAWNFYIGGYQPAQKWLKDRKGRTLDNSDLEHYQKVIIALTGTDRLMQEIDKV